MKFLKSLLFSRVVSTLAGPMTALAFLAMAPSAWAATFDCQPVTVVELSNRIHVQCENSIALAGATVRFIAIDKTDADKAARFISFGQTALLANKIFVADILDSPTSNVVGCRADDCRTPVVFGLKK